MARHAGRSAINEEPGRAGSIDGDADALIATLYDELKIIARREHYRAGGGIVERAVTIGVTNRVDAEVIDGLSPGERVVVGRQVAGAAPGDRAGKIGRAHV